MLMNEDLEEVAEPYHTGNSHQAGLLPIWLIRTDQVEALQTATFCKTAVKPSHREDIVVRKGCRSCRPNSI
jgi:hypothetical protein